VFPAKKERFLPVIFSVATILVISFFAFIPSAVSSYSVNPKTGFAFLPSFNSFIGLNLTAILLAVAFLYRLNKMKEIKA
jgi:hypothetical protein